MSMTRREWLEIAGAAAAGVGRARTAAAQPSRGGDRIGIYPDVEALVRRVADDRASTVTRAGVELRCRNGALATALDRVEVTRPTGARVEVPPDGLLVFAVDIGDAAWVSGELTLAPDANLRPGLRATVLCDTTVVATPMLSAEPWGIVDITDPAPVVAGAPPPTTVTIGPWLMPKGRRYLTVAGPHTRPAGMFTSLRLQMLDRPVERPLESFAFISDTHVRLTGREDWMNRKMGAASAPEFLRTLRGLAREGVSFVMHGGDLTENATREQFVLMRDVLAAQTLPVYGCIGNHDRYLESSRPDALDLLGAHFPGGTLDYVVQRPPLRFVVLDVAIEQERMRDAKVQWLRETLRADTTTPTVFVWHYPPLNRGGVANSGFRLQDWSQLGRETILEVLRDTPNLCACLNGHDHWDEVNVVDGLPFIQNAAFVEWPNTYRVYRVYRDRLEWEVRQVANRGFVRESFLPAKAMSWMIATRDGDGTGSIPLSRRASIQ